MKVKLAPSEFINLKGIEYFKFEEDFIEENVRCIPMVVRFKLDIVGIKLKLVEWSRFKPNERIELALLPVSNPSEVLKYHELLTSLIAKHTGKQPTELSLDTAPAWQNAQQIPELLQEKMQEIKLSITLDKWQKLTHIQRFAILKLCRPGHENKNFPKAVLEFGL